MALLELVLALALTAIVMGVAGAALASTQRTTAKFVAKLQARTELRAVASVLSGVLAGASRADSLPLATDTAVELHRRALTAVVCAPSSAGTVLLSPVGADDVPFTSVVSPPGPGDRARIWTGDSSLAASGRWNAFTVVAYASTSTGACTTPFASPLPPASLVLSPDPAAPAGAPIVVTKRERYMLYRASDGLWQLGMRECSTTGCESAQPIAGPLAAPSDAGPGIQLTYRDASGAAVAGAFAAWRAVAVEFVARSHRPPASAWADSAYGAVSFRNR